MEIAEALSAKIVIILAVLLKWFLHLQNLFKMNQDIEWLHHWPILNIYSICVCGLHLHWMQQNRHIISCCPKRPFKQSSYYKVGHLLACKQIKRGGSPKFFIRTLWCHNYMRLKFRSYKFDIWGALKAVFIHFLEK